MSKQRRELIGAVARVGLATLFTGPVGGLKEAGGQAIGLLSAAPSARTTPAALLSSVQRDVEAFARSEGVGGEFVDQVLETAALAVERHGATVAECVDLNFDAERVTRRVLGRSAALLRGLPSGASDLCHIVIRMVYTRLLADPIALKELDREFQRQVLTRLSDLAELPAATAAAVSRLAAVAALVDPRRSWRVDLFGEASLVRAEFAVVPFRGRERVLDEFDTWCRQGPLVALRLFMGSGGMGKTRLMIEACAQMRAAGWRAGFLAASQEPAAIATFDIYEPTVIVVDYAEVRRQQLHALLAWALSRRTGPPVRIVALARRQGDWWQDLSTKSAIVGDFVRGPASTARALNPLADTIEERAVVVQEAVRSFATRLGRGAPVIEASSLDLAASHFERVLFLHLAALSAVLERPLQKDSDLLDFALDRERGIWNAGVEGAGLRNLRGPAIQQAAAVVTLAGRVDSRDEAVQLLQRAPALRGQSAADLYAVVDLLHTLYPGDAYIEGVQPDLLGEQLLLRQLAETPDLPMVVYYAE